MTEEHCFMCVLSSMDPEKVQNPKLFYGLKEELFPKEDFGDYVRLCTPCKEILEEVLSSEEVLEK